MESRFGRLQLVGDEAAEEVADARADLAPTFPFPGFSAIPGLAGGIPFRSGNVLPGGLPSDDGDPSPGWWSSSDDANAGSGASDDGSSDHSGDGRGDDESDEEGAAAPPLEEELAEWLDGNDRSMRPQLSPFGLLYHSLECWITPATLDLMQACRVQAGHLFQGLVWLAGHLFQGLFVWLATCSRVLSVWLSVSLPPLPPPRALHWESGRPCCARLAVEQDESGCVRSTGCGVRHEGQGADASAVPRGLGGADRRAAFARHLALALPPALAAVGAAAARAAVEKQLAAVARTLYFREALPAIRVCRNSGPASRRTIGRFCTQCFASDRLPSVLPQEDLRWPEVSDFCTRCF
jgi:hypothetical protein